MYRAANICAAPGPHDNRDLLSQILRLRHEEATLLGFADFPDFAALTAWPAPAPPLVASSPTCAPASRPPSTLRTPAFNPRREPQGPDAPTLQPWTSPFTPRRRQALYDFDDEALRPYFPAARVLAGMFEVVQRLYGITVKPTTELSTWHADVQTYVDDEHGTRIGYFYADLFPRDSKRAGAG